MGYRVAVMVDGRVLNNAFGASGGYVADIANAQEAVSASAVARDLGVNEGTLGNWVLKAREAREGTEGLSKGDIEELKRLRAENAELRMERDVLKRSVVLWVKEATK